MSCSGRTRKNGFLCGVAHGEFLPLASVHFSVCFYGPTMIRRIGGIQSAISATAIEWLRSLTCNHIDHIDHIDPVNLRPLVHLTVKASSSEIWSKKNIGAILPTAVQHALLHQNRGSLSR